MNPLSVLLLLAALPAPLEKNLAARFPDAKIVKTEKEKDGNYEVKLASKTETFEVTITPAGEVIGEEREVKIDAVPAAVQTAIAALSEKTERIEQVTVHGQTVFEVVTRDAKGKKIETVFDADGSRKERKGATE